jgi:hypothetical protein
MKRNLLGFIFFTALVTACYFLAVRFSLFYIFNWFDNIVHTLAGMALGFLGFALFPKNKYAILGLALSVSILWEIFERIGHVWWPAWIGFGGVGDTILDILCGILGALIIIIWKKNNTTRI